MIDPKKLTPKDVGKKVIYDCGIRDTQPGRIKSWNEKWVFVVYHCDNDWDNFQNYTAAATDPTDLFFDEDSQATDKPVKEREDQGDRKSAEETSKGC